MWVAFLIVALLLLLNGFLVLAEFAMVKTRPSRIEELVDQGNAKAVAVQHIQNNMDEYLSVCQVGITFASIGLGFAGEHSFAALLKPMLGSWASHAVAITMAYILISFLHILLGELVPKSLAIRRSDGAALFMARPLKFFRTIFYVPLVVLNGSANLVLRLIGVRGKVHDPRHSEAEIRIILARSQSMGMMSFRRLLLIENVLDLGNLKARDAMKPRDAAKVVRTSAPWEENWKVINETRLSRYPLVDGKEDMPLGVIHVKDLLYEGRERLPNVDLRELARPAATTYEDTSLESLLADLQRRRGHLVIVLDKDDRWTGFITLEDIIEEIVGTIEDEFEVEPPLFLADALTTGRIVLDLKASSMDAAVREAIGRVPAAELPASAEKITEAVLERESKMPTYLGRGLAIPHARLEGLAKPFLVFARSDKGIPVTGSVDKARLLFILLSPVGTPKVQARLLTRIGGLMDSEYVEERLTEAKSPQAILEAIKAGDPAALS